MPTNEMWVTEGSPSAASSAIDIVERPSADKFTTTTADPGAAGTALAVTSAAKFPTTNGYRVRLLGTSGNPETVLVTAGAGTTSWTIQRAQDGTTGVSHSIGATVSLIVGVQRVEPVNGSKAISYNGRVTTFRTPGRAGVSQKIAALHNATGSTVIVDIQRITIDCFQTAVKAVTIKTPVIRICRFTAIPTNGTALTKTPLDTALSSNAAVTVWGDASADGTSSGTTLTVTIPAGSVLASQFGPRVFTAVGYEEQDQQMFFEGEPDITLRALEGVCVFLEDAVTSTGNPITDSWVSTIHWTEYRIA
jgi:hypothetical protein